ncbi:hypothetical protein HCZ30_05865 [Marivivens donghaensis]|uniref:DUF4760 domain-containing protein n=1 Tax=Marivivens donghaensis TaxID=1699413 RepID=A0ABX0VV59_9RHOB|nr:hypothetical protein [Marivivens donghaensis]
MIGLLFGIAFFLVLDSDLTEQTKNYFVEIVSILVVLLSAGIATYGVLVTLDFQDRSRQLDRNGRLTANRILLSAVLSEIYRIAEHNARVVLAKGRAARDGEGINDDELTRYEHEYILPFVTGENFAIFQNVIEFADPQTRNWLSAISNHFQVAKSRTEGTKIEPLEENEIIGVIGTYENVLEWILVRNLAANCFKYARGEVPEMEDRISTKSWLFPLLQDFSSNRPIKIIREYDSLIKRQNVLFESRTKESSASETLRFDYLVEKQLIYSNYPSPSK